MTRTMTAALLATVALGATAAGAATMAPPQAQPKNAKDYKLTKEVRALAAEAQTMITAGDTAGATAKINQATPLAKTDDDKYVLGSLMVDAGGKTNDTALQRRGLETMIASGNVTGAELGKLQYFVGRFAYTAGDYPTALTQFNAARTAGYVDPQLDLLIADASFKGGNGAQGMATLRKAVEAELAAGRKPNENWLKKGVSEAYTAKQPQELTWWLTQSIKAYPTPANWRNALVIYRDGAQLDPAAELDLMRLMRATKSLQGERDVFDYANAANDRGLPGEAKAVIDEARASGQVSPDRAAFKQLYTVASGRVAGDRASLLRDEKSAGAAKDGKAAMAAADGFLGYGDYAKAAGLYATALQKGGVDANTANTRLGIALAMSGQKAQAQEAFAKVTGPRAGVVDYWELYLEQRA